MGSREGYAMPGETTLGEEAASVVEDDDPIYVKKVEHLENKSQSGPRGYIYFHQIFYLDVV
jgi:hypothetical protein